MTRWVSREMKWFLPAEDMEDEAKVIDQVHLEAKVLEEDRHLEGLEQEEEEMVQEL